MVLAYTKHKKAWRSTLNSYTIYEISDLECKTALLGVKLKYKHFKGVYRLPRSNLDLALARPSTKHSLNHKANSYHGYYCKQLEENCSDNTTVMELLTYFDITRLAFSPTTTTDYKDK